MERLPAKTNPASTPSLPERAAHRDWIGGRALTLLSHYWRDDDPVELTAAIGRDWADILEGMPQELIQRACVAYMRDEPRRKPTPGEIYQRAKGYLPKPMPVSVEDRRTTAEDDAAYRASVARDNINPERAAQAAEIMRGFAPKRMRAAE